MYFFAEIEINITVHISRKTLQRAALKKNNQTTACKKSAKTVQLQELDGQWTLYNGQIHSIANFMPCFT